jgi:hypothetical protein
MLWYLSNNHSHSQLQQSVATATIPNHIAAAKATVVALEFCGLVISHAAPVHIGETIWYFTTVHTEMQKKGLRLSTIRDRSPLRR